MNTSTSTIRQFSLIFDEIYNEKHVNFSKIITKWHHDKEQYLANHYKQSIDRLFEDIQSNHKIFEKRITELLKVANAEYQIFSKVKSFQDKQSTAKTTSITTLSQDESQLFHSTLQKIHKKSSDIQQMSQFASRFFAITSIELNEFKSFTSQIQNRRQRYLFDYKKQTLEDNKVLNQLCLKSESKYFSIRLLERLREGFQKEVKILSKVNSDIRKSYQVSLNKRRQILQNCIDNMTKYEELLVKVFCDNMVGDIRKFFDTLVQQLNKLIAENDIKQKEYLQVKQLIDREFQALYQQNVHIFNFIMEDITMGEWKNTTLQVIKKSSFTSFSQMNFGSSHHTLREDSIPDDSNKQFSIPSSTHKQSPQSSSDNQMILTLTIDYKLVFRKAAQKNKIYRQYLLNDLRVKSQSQKKKVMNQSTLTLKDKSSKQILQISFNDANKRQQFLLHIERYEQLKNTLGK